MSKLKYIVDELGGFAIFSGYINHDTVGRQFELRGAPPVGAGFIEIFDGKVHCYGKSQSLKLTCRGEADDIVIANALDLDVAE